MAILELKNITKIYSKGTRRIEALKGIDLTVEKGEFSAIVGPSGSGKSTALNIIGCLDSPTEGTLTYNKEIITGKKEAELAEFRKDKIGFVFQSYNLIPVLTVRENVELPLIIEKTYTKHEIRDRVEEILEAVGLREMIDRKPGELSGGQEQRVAVARALVKEPLLVLADEPTANLDSVTSEEIIELMREINRTREATFLFSTHDELVMKHAGRVITLRDGRIDGKKESRGGGT